MLFVVDTICQTCLTQSSFSIRGYLFFAPWKAQLVKYTEFCTSFFSLIKAMLTAAEETIRYRNNSFPGLDELNNGGEERYVFRSSNTY